MRKTRFVGTCECVHLREVSVLWDVCFKRFCCSVRPGEVSFYCIPVIFEFRLHIFRGFSYYCMFCLQNNYLIEHQDFTVFLQLPVSCFDKVKI